MRLSEKEKKVLVFAANFVLAGELPDELESPETLQRACEKLKCSLTTVRTRRDKEEEEEE